MTRRAKKGLDLKKNETNQQWEAYKEIFGCRKESIKYPGDAAAADRVISEYASKFPPLEGGQKAGKGRGELDLTQFVVTKGATKFKTDLSDRPKWDKEFFCCQLQTLRRWLSTRCEAKWEELAADPANFADNGGPDPKAPMRLFIPANLVGGDKDSSGNAQFETKELKESSRAVKHMTDEVKESLLENTNKGFGTLTGVTAQQLSAPSTMSSSSATAADVSDLLLTATGKEKEKEKDKEKDAKDSNASDGGGAAASKGGQPASGQAEGVVGAGVPPKFVADLRIAKNTMTRKVRQTEYAKKESALM